MAGWKATLDASEKSYVIHHAGRSVDASIGTSATPATFYSFIDAVDDGDEPAMEEMTEEQITARLTANGIDPDNDWK